MIRPQHLTTLLSLLLLSLNPAAATGCNQDNCYRALSNRPSAATSFCRTFTTSSQAIPTASPPPFTSQCANSPSRISSACSCLVSSPTSSSVGVCEPTPAMDVARNGGFDQVFIPEGGAIEEMPPWKFHDLTHGVKGDFIRLPSNTHGETETGYGAAAFHIPIFPPTNGDPALVPRGFLSAEISICPGRTYTLSFWGTTESASYYQEPTYCFATVHSALQGEIGGAPLYNRGATGDYVLTKWEGWTENIYTPSVEPVVNGVGREGSVFRERGIDWEGRGWRGWGWNDTLTFEVQCYDSSPWELTAVIDGIKLV